MTSYTVKKCDIQSIDKVSLFLQRINDIDCVTNLTNGTIASLMSDDSVFLNIAIENNEEGLVRGFVLYYFHYSTWERQSIVIRHLKVLDEDEKVAKDLITSVYEAAQNRKITRIDTFTTDIWLKPILVNMGSYNVTEKDEFICFSIKC